MFTEPHIRRRDAPKHPMAPALITKASELGIGFKYYEAYADIRDGGEVGFDLVALLLAQLPNLNEFHLTWFNTQARVRMPMPRSGWPWKQSSKKIFT